MYKESISAQEVCQYLNDFLKADPEAINILFNFRTDCNDRLSEHPTIQVREPVDNGGPRRVGFIGILNGVLGVNEDTGMGAICYEVDEETDNIIKFRTTYDARDLTLYEDEE